MIKKIVVSNKAVADNTNASVANKAHVTDKAVAPKVAIESNAEAKVVEPGKPMRLMLLSLTRLLTKLIRSMQPTRP